MTFDDSALLHSQVYDPVKARAYYLRTRKLKGRQGPSGDDSSSSRSPAAPVSKKDGGSNRQAEIAAQQASLEKRLEQLREVLAKLVEKSQAKAGVKEPTDPKEKAAENTAKKGKKPTAKEKKEAADRFEKYKKDNPEKVAPAKEVQNLQQQIADVRKQIAAAIAEARKSPKSKSQTAPKGR